MRLLKFSAGEFASTLHSLLPPGRAWSQDGSLALNKLLLGLAQVYGRNSDRAAQLLVDAFPTTTTELLPEWEESLGLPTKCAGLAPSLALRRAQVVARFIGNGRPTKQFFIDYAAALGYTITITYGDAALQVPFLCGVNVCGDPLVEGGDEANPWVWFVHGALLNVEYFRCGVNVCGDPLVTADDNAALVCEMERIRPAHTVLRFVLA